MQRNRLFEIPCNLPRLVAERLNRGWVSERKTESQLGHAHVCISSDLDRVRGCTCASVARERSEAKQAARRLARGNDKQPMSVSQLEVAYRILSPFQPSRILHFPPLPSSPFTVAAVFDFHWCPRALLFLAGVQPPWRAESNSCCKSIYQRVFGQSRGWEWIINLNLNRRVPEEYGRPRTLFFRIFHDFHLDSSGRRKPVTMSDLVKPDCKVSPAFVE